MRIRVPDVPHPTLCWRQKLDPPGALGRCDRPRDHLGPHSWALADCVRDLGTVVEWMQHEASVPVRADSDLGVRVVAYAECATRVAAVLAPYRARLESSRG